MLDLNEEELMIAWSLYIEKLGNKNNHSGVSNFKSSELKIIDSNTIEIITDNSMQQMFIEAERGELITYLQEYFNNRLLSYRVKMVERADKNELKEEHLTGRQQYLKMIEIYPLVKDLKDRLGLRLD